MNRFVLAASIIVSCFAALSAQAETLAQGGSQMEVALRKYPVAGILAVDVELTSEAVRRDATRVSIGLYEPGGPAPIAKTTLGRLRDEAAVSAELTISGLEAGCYEVWVTAHGADDRTLATAQTSFARPAGPPWLGAADGRVGPDLVPHPWSPLERDGAALICWGRRYDFGPDGLLDKVLSDGAQLLARPVRIVTTPGGAVNTADWGLTISAGPSRATIEAAGRGLGLRRSWMEYDGLLVTEVTVAPSEAGALQTVTLEVALKTQYARYYHFYPGRWGSAYNSGAIPPEGMKLPFKPFIWVGDESRGLAWFCESDAGWEPLDRENAIEIAREGEVTVLRIHLRTEEAAPRGPVTYTFGFQATPVKPRPPDFHSWHITHGAYYGVEGQLDRLKDLGVNTLVFHESWTDIQNHVTTTHGDKLRSLVAACHARGIQLLLYFGYEISTIAPEWEDYHAECLTYPRAGGYTRQPDQTAYICCYRSHWADFMAQGIARVLDEYGIDGIYLDGTANPWVCSNEYHGCGYRAPDGALRPTYPILAVREMMRRLYVICRERKPDAMINVHQSTCMTIPTLAYATSYWDGEQFGFLQETADPLSLVPLDAFRAEFMGHQWGVPAEFLVYPPRPYTTTQALALTLPHDVLIHPALGEQLEEVARYWKAFEAFGVDRADWVPYWRASPYATTQSRDCLVSLYRRPGEALLIVSNLLDEARTVALSLDLAALGIGTIAVATDALTGETLPHEGRTIQVPMPAFSPRALRVSAAAASESFQTPIAEKCTKQRP